MTATDLHTRRRMTLGRPRQVRFTARQEQLLARLSRECDRPIGALLRDIVVVWAIQRLNESGELDVEGLVAELRELEDVE